MMRLIAIVLLVASVSWAVEVWRHRRLPRCGLCLVGLDPKVAVGAGVWYCGKCALAIAEVRCLYHRARKAS